MAAEPQKLKDLKETPFQKDSEVRAWMKDTLQLNLDLGETQFEMEKPLVHYGLDSLTAVRLLTKIRDRLKIPIEINELFESPSLGEFYELILERWKGGATSVALKRSKSPDLVNEAVLDPSIQFSEKSFPFPKHPKKILLTGASGFLGAFLLNKLLTETDATLFCLVRSPDIESGKKKIKENLTFFSLWDTSKENRIEPVLGDLAKPRLGINKDVYDQLARELDIIYHNGANVNFIYDYWDLKSTNALGTQEVIRLAGQEKLIPLHYISTLSVFPMAGHPEDETFFEEDFAEISEGLMNGYAQSKWVAENMLRQAGEEGLPFSIYRVGEVIGHSKTGICRAEKDAYCNMIRGGILLGCVPALNINLYLVPVDYVAQAVVKLSQKEESLGQTFHLTGEPIPGSQIFERLQEENFELERMSFQDWLDELQELSRDLGGNPLETFMPWITSGPIQKLATAQTLLKIDDQKTRQKLSKVGVSLPSASESFSRYLGYLKSSGFLDF